MIVANYQDDGPDGPCGQDVYTTSPWNQLHFFKDRDEYRRWEERGQRGRQNSRYVNIWEIDHDSLESSLFTPSGGRMWRVWGLDLVMMIPIDPKRPDFSIEGRYDLA